MLKTRVKQYKNIDIIDENDMKQKLNVIMENSENKEENKEIKDGFISWFAVKDFKIKTCFNSTDYNAVKLTSGSDYFIISENGNEEILNVENFLFCLLNYENMEKYPLIKKYLFIDDYYLNPKNLLLNKKNICVFIEILKNIQYFLKFYKKEELKIILKKLNNCFKLVRMRLSEESKDINLMSNLFIAYESIIDTLVESKLISCDLLND